MQKKPIHSVITEVLRKTGRPMTAREIYEHIERDKLYQFNAKDPANIVRTQLRRHCIGVKSSGGSGAQYFKTTDDGLFDLLERSS